MVRAAANSETLWFDSGTYNLSTMVAVTLSGSVVLRGSGKSLVNLIGANGKSLFTLAAGGSFSASGLGFTTWDSVCRLADNTVGGAFPFLEMDDCYLNGVNYSAIWDGAVYAPGGITELRWTRNLSVSCGRINANAAALRLDVDNIISAFVDGNEIRGVGGSGFSGQKQGIQLGAISRTSNASMIVTNNRIFDVQNSDTSNVSGIIVFGYNTNVSGNTIHTVKSASASNIDQYGIYTKSAFSVIIGNILTDAGGNAACIMTKGFPNDVNGFALNSTNLRNIISKNTVRLESRWTTQVMNGIAFYNSGMMVSENIIDGVTVGIVAIPPVSAAVEHCTIRGNKISNLSGQASQTAVGIQVSSPAFCTIESNEVQNVGSGVETRAYGISMVNDANGVFGTFQGLFITNNLIRKALASTTANSRGIMLAFFASGSFSFLKVEGNVVDECPLGIQSAFGGTYSDIHFRNNILRNCSVSYLAWSGTPPADGVMAGNIINGLPYTTIAAGVTTPSVGGVNHIRTANVGATTITNLTNGYGNQSVLLEVNDNFTTVQHGANIKLAGSVNWVPANGGILHLIRMGSTWKEVGRVTY